MRTSLTVLLTASLMLTACGGWKSSRINPTNWFGSSKSTPAPNPEATGPVNPLIPANANNKSIFAKAEEVDKSVQIQSVTALVVEPTSTGAIVRATGLASRQGGYQTSLRLVSSEEDIESGTLSYSFRVVYPDEATPVGSEATRTINEAVSLPHKALDGIRVIRVIAETNVRETRRR